MKSRRTWYVAVGCCYQAKDGFFAWATLHLPNSAGVSNRWNTLMTRDELGG